MREGEWVRRGTAADYEKVRMRGRMGERTGSKRTNDEERTGRSKSERRRERSVIKKERKKSDRERSVIEKERERETSSLGKRAASNPYEYLLQAQSWTHAWVIPSKRREEIGEGFPSTMTGTPCVCVRFQLCMLCITWTRLFLFTVRKVDSFHPISS